MTSEHLLRASALGALRRLPAEVRAALAEARACLEEMYGESLVELVLFGSRARGDAERDSDIDLLAVLRGDVQPSSEISRAAPALAEISLRLAVVLSCAFVSEDRFRNERSPFLINVRREGVSVRRDGLAA